MRREVKDLVEWHLCHCGCYGWETIYRGRLFWLGRGPDGYLLFGGIHAHTGHSHYRGGSAGFHVGNFDYKTKRAAGEAVLKHYKKYEKLPPLGWHPCNCNKPEAHFTVCLKGVRFYGKWHDSISRFELFYDHSGDSMRGFYKKSEIDSVIRELARKPRLHKRPRVMLSDAEISPMIDLSDLRFQRLSSK